MDRTDSRFAPSPGTASDDVASPFKPAGSSGAGRPPGDPLPWEGDPPEESGRQRHDSFTGAKKQLFLKALAGTGCILDACRITGISSGTVYNHRANDPDFARYCAMAVDMASTPLELTAYERAVVGVEEEVLAEMAEPTVTFEDAIVELDKALDSLGAAQSMNSEGLDSRVPCSWIPDQVRDDEEGESRRPGGDSSVPTSKPHPPGILTDEPPGAVA